ncbi:MAG: response regulator [Candidatus Xenobia bacterium]
MRIIVVDGNRASAQRVAEMLRTEGFEVVVASSGAQALQSLADGRVDGMLIDVQERLEEGLRLVREARAARPDMPIVACSATIIPYETAALQAGCNAFIEKPFVASEVASVATWCLRKAVAA